MTTRTLPSRARPRVLAGWIASLLALALILAACGDGAATDPTPTPAPEPTPTAAPTPEPTPEPTPTLEAATPEPTSEPTPTPEPAEEAEWSPNLLFSHQYASPTGNVKVASVAFSPSGDTVAAGYFMKALIFDVPDGEIRQEIDLTHSADGLDFSADGALIGAALSHGGVRIVNVADGTQAFSLGGGFDSRVAFSPDGETIATGNRDAVVWLWSVASGVRTATLEPSTSQWLTALAFSPDGALLASGHWGGTVYLWDTADGTVVQTFENPGRYGYATQLAFSPDGTLLAVAGAQEGFQNVVRLWNVSDGSVYGVPQFQSDTRTVAFSPDGELLAVGTARGVSLWQVSDLTRVDTLPFTSTPGVSNWITDLAFSPDGTMLVAGHWNGTLELWRVRE